MGGRSFATPAIKTELGGTEAGSWITLRAGKIGHSALAAATGMAGQAVERWSACAVRHKGLEVLWVAAYFHTGARARELNQVMAQQLAGAIGTWSGLFVLVADWNQTIEEAKSLQLHTFLGADFLKPEGSDYTCTASTGISRCIDFAMVSRPLARYLSLRVDLDSPWKPHLGLFISFRWQPEQDLMLTTVNPAEFGGAAGPLSRPWGVSAFRPGNSSSLRSVTPTLRTPPRESSPRSMQSSPLQQRGRWLIPKQKVANSIAKQHEDRSRSLSSPQCCACLQGATCSGASSPISGRPSLAA